MDATEAPTPIWLPFAIIGAFCIVFPAFWCAVVWLISRIGGWRALAKRYRSGDRPVKGEMANSVLGMVGLASYRYTLVAHFTDDGFFLETMILFRIGHPRLFIPWSDIAEVRPTKWMLIESTRLTVGSPRVSTITLPSKLLLQHFPGKKSPDPA